MRRRKADWKRASRRSAARSGGPQRGHDGVKIVGGGFDEIANFLGVRGEGMLLRGEATYENLCEKGDAGEVLAQAIVQDLG